jgi:predicted nucleic acid-binding protein
MLHSLKPKGQAHPPMEGQCSVLYSEDLQHGQHSGDLQIENPFS